MHVIELPYDYINFDLNYEEANYIIETEKIPYILLAPSDIIKPMDIQKLMLDDSILLYDISQIMGLISGKQINNPLKISSNIVLLGGTHKTLPGPASGIIMTNNEEIHQTIVNILARRNHNSGKLETGIPDAGNQLNSA